MFLNSMNEPMVEKSLKNRAETLVTFLKKTVILQTFHVSDY